MVLGTAALLWVLAATGDGGQGRHNRAADTDETVAVSRGTRLALENASGSVEVHTWDRDSLRVQARHAAGTKVLIRARPEVRDGTRRFPGRSRGIAWSTDITAPAWIPCGSREITTTSASTGRTAMCRSRTCAGDIAITKGSGSVTANTIEGQVTIEGGRGKVDVSSVNDGINITGASR